MNDELAMKGLVLLEQFSSLYQVITSHLLLLNSNGCEFSKRFIDYCASHKIILLPPFSYKSYATIIRGHGLATL